MKNSIYTYMDKWSGLKCCGFTWAKVYVWRGRTQISRQVSYRCYNIYSTCFHDDGYYVYCCDDDICQSLHSSQRVSVVCVTWGKESMICCTMCVSVCVQDEMHIIYFLWLSFSELECCLEWDISLELERDRRFLRLCSGLRLLLWSRSRRRLVLFLLLELITPHSVKAVDRPVHQLQLPCELTDLLQCVALRMCTIKGRGYFEADNYERAKI